MTIRIHDFNGATLANLADPANAQDAATLAHVANKSAYIYDAGLYGLNTDVDTTIAFNDSTYQFTLSPTGSTWVYYRQGKKNTITGSKTVTLAGTPPTAAKYFIYIDDDIGTLTASQSAWTLQDTKVPVAILSFNNGNTPKYLLGDERHPANITRGDHYYHHFADGTKLISASTLSGLTAATDTAVAKRPTISAGMIADETLIVSLSQLTPTGSPYTATDYSLAYRTASNAWAWAKSDMPFAYNSGTNALQYDNAGTLTDIPGGVGSNARYANSYLCMTTEQGDFRFCWIPGQGVFTTAAAAQAENPANFTFTNFPLAEYVVVWRVTWAVDSASYTSKGKCVYHSSSRVQISSTTVVPNGNTYNISYGTGTPSGGNDGDIYLQYTA